MASRLLVLGGTRSGKSRYAFERAVSAGGDAVTFVATARPGDPELDVRIAAHRRHRPAAWRTIEVVEDLAGGIAAAAADHVALVDSLTLWAATVVEAETTLRTRWASAAHALSERRTATIFVSEVVGMGIVPPSELGRRFVDELGWLDQQVAAMCDEVRLMVAGIPMPIKGAATDTKGARTT